MKSSYSDARSFALNKPPPDSSTSATALQHFKSREPHSYFKPISKRTKESESRSTMTNEGDVREEPYRRDEQKDSFEQIKNKELEVEEPIRNHENVGEPIRNHEYAGESTRSRERVREPIRVTNNDDDTGEDQEFVDVVDERSEHIETTTIQTPRAVTYSESKRLEVLLVMFPEIEEATLREILTDFRFNIQDAVEYLLRRKRIAVCESHHRYGVCKKHQQLQPQPQQQNQDSEMKIERMSAGRHMPEASVTERFNSNTSPRHIKKEIQQEEKME